MRNTSLDRLIAAAKEHDHPPVETTQRAWASLRSAIEAGIGPSVPVVASASATTGLGVKGIVVVVVAVVMAGAAAIGLRDDGDEPVAVAASQETPRATERPAPPERTKLAAHEQEEDAAASEVVPAPFANAAEPVPDVAPRSEPNRSGSSQPTPSEPAAALENKSTLAEQARLLGEAWKAVNAGRSAHALELVAEHARRFPDSPLGPEREACRIVAWCVDERPWAAEKARAFLATHGGLPASRVRRACGEKE
jgi:hypothetical protein